MPGCAGGFPAGAVPLPHPARRCADGAVGCDAVQVRAGGLAGGAVHGAGVRARARVGVRLPERRPDRLRRPAGRADRGAAAAAGRPADDVRHRPDAAGPPRRPVRRSDDDGAGARQGPRQLPAGLEVQHRGGAALGHLPLGRSGPGGGVLPGDDDTQVAVAEIRDLLGGVEAAGRWKPGGPPPLICLDSGNSSTAITHALEGRDVQLVIRLKSNRSFRGRPEPRQKGQRGPAQRQAERLALKNGGQRPAPDLRLVRQSDRYGQMQITAWRHMHQELDRSGPFKDWPKDQDLPVVEGTVVRMKVERLPDGRKADKDMWLWIAGPMEPDAGLADLAWTAYLRRFDQEHFHRFSKVYLGMDRAHLASAQATDRWVALALAAYTQLRLAAPVVPDSSRPWHKKLQAGEVLTPYRTRLGFPRLRPQLGTPAKPAKSVKAGPGRPKGSKNRPKNRQPVHRKGNAKPAKAPSAASQAP